MTVFSGKGVYGAIAIGKLSIFKKNDTTIKRMHVEDTEAEKARVEAAKAAACEQLQAIYEKALKEVGETNAQIFEIHIMMLEDEDYNESIANIIETQKVNAEYAVAVTADNFAEMFSSMDDAYMQARATDVKDISNRIIANLTGNISGADASEESMIICADDLAPSETVSLDKDKVLAFVTAHGSSNSHTAILARNMNIPAVIGVGDAFLAGDSKRHGSHCRRLYGRNFCRPRRRNKGSAARKAAKRFGTKTPAARTQGQEKHHQRRHRDSDLCQHWRR